MPTTLGCDVGENNGRETEWEGAREKMGWLHTGSTRQHAGGGGGGGRGLDGDGVFCAAAATVMVWLAHSNLLHSPAATSGTGAEAGEGARAAARSGSGRSGRIVLGSRASPLRRAYREILGLCAKKLNVSHCLVRRAGAG